MAVVARTYRKAIDDYLKDENLYRQNLPYYREQIAKCTYRQFTTGFFFGKPTHETQIYDSNTYVKEYTYLGIINGQNSQGMYGLEQRNKFSVGETIEVMKPDGRDLPSKYCVSVMKKAAIWKAARIQNRKSMWILVLN